jgi:hypothetical protein
MLSYEYFSDDKLAVYKILITKITFCNIYIKIIADKKCIIASKYVNFVHLSSKRRKECAYYIFHIFL